MNIHYAFVDAEGCRGAYHGHRCGRSKWCRSHVLSLRFLSALSAKKKHTHLRWHGICGRYFGYLPAITLPSSPPPLTFDPATAPCAVMLPTGEQLSTSSTLNNLSSSEDGIR